MKLMVIGGGGREHAIIKKLRENPAVDTIWALPGNGGIAADATCVPVKATDIDGIVRFAKENPVDYAVVAPDDPLVLGCVDALEAIGIPCFGPRKNAAIIEGSKVFSKDLMKKYGIPTAEYRVFDNAEDALEYLKEAPTHGGEGGRPGTGQGRDRGHDPGGCGSCRARGHGGQEIRRERRPDRD